MLNGIADIMAAYHDLGDRALSVRLEQIPKRKRRPESKFWSDFWTAHPRILGALLDAVSVALARLPTIVLTEVPRMADFAHWVVAAEPGLGWPEGTFMAAYERMLGDRAADALEGDLVGGAIGMLMAHRKEWSGTATDLKKTLEEIVPERDVRTQRWPGAANALSNRLRRVAPSLREFGIDVQFGRGKDEKPQRLIRITWGEKPQRFTRTATDGSDGSDNESRRLSEASSDKLAPNLDIDDEPLVLNPDADAFGEEQEGA